MTNNINRPDAGVGPLFEDANSLGARDMGLLSDALPGYQPFETTVDLLPGQKMKIQTDLVKGSIAKAGSLVSQK